MKEKNIKGLKPEFMTLEQLQKRSKWWGNICLDNILQFADEGLFGLYFKSKNANSQKIYFVAKGNLKILKKGHKTIQEYEKEKYTQLIAGFIRFCKTHKALLKYKPGFYRLATSEELEIFPLLESGSIAQMRKNAVIVGRDYNNAFGLTFIERKIVSPKSNLKQISEADLFVFTDEIEAFEMQNINISSPKQTRTSQLHDKIKGHCDLARNGKYNWNLLIELAEADDPIIQEVTNWEDINAEIRWTSGIKEQSLSKKGFQNILSNLKNPKK